MLASSVLDPLYRIVGWLLAVLYYPTHNLGIAIIMLTLIVMFIQLPLIAKQTRSMILMQRVQRLRHPLPPTRPSLPIPATARNRRSSPRRATSLVR